MTNNKRDQLGNETYSEASVSPTYFPKSGMFALKMEEDSIRPPIVFRKGYTVLENCTETHFGGITLRKTKNGRKAKNGVALEREIHQT